MQSLKMGVITILFIVASLLMVTGCEDVIVPAHTKQNQDYILVGNYIGKTFEQISKEIEISNFDIREIYSSEIDAGVIIYQYPFAKKEIKKGRDITLYMSKGIPEEKWDIVGLEQSKAEDILKRQGVQYSLIFDYNPNINKGQVFGVGKSAEEYSIYISEGSPTLETSGTPGYVVKTGGFIFYTDDKNIYRMNPNGTEKKTLIEASGMTELIPYGDWLVYLRKNQLCCYNWDKEESIRIRNVIWVYYIIDENVYFEDIEGLKSLSLVSGNIYIIDEIKRNDSIADMILNNNRLFYVFNSEASVLMCKDILKADTYALKETEDIYDLCSAGSEIYYTTKNGLYIINQHTMTGEFVTDLDYLWMYYVLESNIVYNTSEEIYIYDYVTGKKDIICKNNDYLGVDKINGWVYYKKNESTYRKKVNGVVEEFFSKQIIHSYYYKELVFIDDWIYFFDTDGLLSRINVESKNIEHLADEPTEMPWWGSI